MKCKDVDYRLKYDDNISSHLLMEQITGIIHLNIVHQRNILENYFNQYTLIRVFT